MFSLRSTNLSFRPIQLGDERYTFPEIDEKLTRYWINWEPSRNIEEEREVIKNKVKLSENLPSIEFIVFNNQKEFIGCCGISPSEENGEFEINIWIKHSAQGKGYGREMLNMILSWARDNTNLNYLIYSITDGNQASFRLIKNINASVVRKITYPKRGVQKEVVDYKIFLR